MITIQIELTPEEANKLHWALLMYEDEGPTGEGWASPTLERLIAKVDAAFQKAQAGADQ